MAGLNISPFEVDRKLVLKVGGWLHLAQNWRLYLKIEGQKCESEKTQWKEKDGRDRQVV